MRKHLFLSVMLGLCAFSGMTVYPTPAMATVTQSPTIKVRGQIVDEQGEPIIWRQRVIANLCSISEGSTPF